MMDRKNRQRISRFFIYLMVFTIMTGCFVGYTAPVEEVEAASYTATCPKEGYDTFNSVRNWVDGKTSITFGNAMGSVSLNSTSQTFTIMIKEDSPLLQMFGGSMPANGTYNVSSYIEDSNFMSAVSDYGAITVPFYSASCSLCGAIETYLYEDEWEDENGYQSSEERRPTILIIPDEGVDINTTYFYYCRLTKTRSSGNNVYSLNLSRKATLKEKLEEYIEDTASHVDDMENSYYEGTGYGEDITPPEMLITTKEAFMTKTHTYSYEHSCGNECKKKLHTHTLKYDSVSKHELLCTQTKTYIKGDELGVCFEHCMACDTCIRKKVYLSSEIQETGTDEYGEPGWDIVHNYSITTYVDGPHYFYWYDSAEDSCYELGDVRLGNIKYEYEHYNGAEYDCDSWYYKCEACDYHRRELYGIEKWEGEPRGYWNASGIFYGNLNLPDVYGKYTGIYVSEWSSEEGIAVIEREESRNTGWNCAVFHRPVSDPVCGLLEYGEKVCHKVVTKIHPLEQEQKLLPGEDPNALAYVKYMNGYLEGPVECDVIGFNPTQYNVWQEVKLAYGEYSSVSNKTPCTATIRVYVERTDADLTLKVSPEGAGTLTGAGMYPVNTHGVTASTVGYPGYVFEGWYDEETGALMSENADYSFTMPSKNLSLIAKYTPKVYDVKAYSEFTSMGTASVKSKDGSHIDKAACGSEITFVATPKKGFTFYGWYDGVNMVLDEDGNPAPAEYTITMPSYHMNLMARFTSNNVTVSFDTTGGNSIVPIYLPYKGMYGNLPVPEKAGHYFVGWVYIDTNGVITEIKETSTVERQSNHTLTATWEVAGPDFILVNYGNKYGKNSWSLDPVNIGTMGLTGENLGYWLPYPVKILDPAKGYNSPGYDFVGWYRTEDSLGNGSDLGDAYNLVTRDTLMELAEHHKLYAGWTPIISTLHFDSNGGSSCASTKITYDRAYPVLPVPTKAGYTFAGWFFTEMDENGYGEQVKTGDHVTFYAREEKDRNLTVYAKWTQEAVNLTATFDAKEYGQAGLTTQESLEAGYGSTVGKIISGSPERNLTYPGTYGKYAMTWDRSEEVEHPESDGWREYGNQYYFIDYTSIPTAFPTVSRVGYTFDKWVYYDTLKTPVTKTEITPETMTQLPINHTIYATYTPKEYAVTLNGNGATSTTHLASFDILFDDGMPDLQKSELPTKTNHSFLGYFDAATGGKPYFDENGTALVDYYTTAGDITLYAHWEKDTVITYHGNGGSGSVGPTYVKKGETTATLLPNTFVKTGYTFDKEYTWNTKITGVGISYADGETIPVTRNMVLYAQWKSIKYHVYYADDIYGKQTKFEKEDWYYDTLYTIRTMNHKSDSIGYDMNDGQTHNGYGMSTLASMTTEESKIPRELIYLFKQWNQYKKDGTVYTKESAFYTAGQTGVKNLTSVEGTEFAFFPEWNTIPVSVTLPIASRRGYNFLGWSKSSINNTTIYSDTYAEAGNVTLYAQWEPKQSKVDLDDRGATSIGHTESVYMVFDKTGPDIIVPTKTGYTFHGYYTEKRGGGIQYYKADGTCTKSWTEDNMDKLYAYWIQDEVEPPKEDDYIEPTPLPDIVVEGTVGRTDGVGLLYADDYDDATGALDDMQPYLTYDTPGGEGVIPGTEELSFRARLGSWMLDYEFHRFSGTDYVRIYVTVPYRTQYELENEQLVVSEQQIKEYNFLVPKTWSYWEVVESGMYYPDSITLENDAIKNGCFTVAVNRDGAAAVKPPSYSVTNHGEKGNHVFWEEYDTDGVPVLYIELEEEEYIISDKINTLPDVDRHLLVVCKNAAWEDKQEAEVRSDYYEFGGKTVLSDDYMEGGYGAVLDETKLPENADEVELTSYPQTYASGIEMDELKSNGRYSTMATITYIGDALNISARERKEVELNDINDLNIHTPVACNGVVVDGIVEEDGERVIVLKEALNFFILRIDNTGTHRMSLGYGAKDFSTALSGKSNVAVQDSSVLNQIKFPFDVYVDAGNDTLSVDGTWDTTGDYYIEAGTWVTVGRMEQRFYVPVTQKNGTYQVAFRSVAVNCPKDSNGKYVAEGVEQENVNCDETTYVAADSLEVKIKSYLKDFGICSVTDSGTGNSGMQLSEGCQALTLKKGYGFTYEVLSQGEFYGENSEIKIIPSYFWISDNEKERMEVKLYRSKLIPDNEKRECYAWENEPILEGLPNSDVILQQWSGNGMIPYDVLCVALDTMQGYCDKCKAMRYFTNGKKKCEICQTLIQKQQPFSLEQYALMQTFTGKEAFFLQTGYLVIHFEIMVKSEEDVWYAFSEWMSTELAQDAIEEGWNYIPGDVIRYDLRKSIMDDYEIGGME